MPITGEAQQGSKHRRLIQAGEHSCDISRTFRRNCGPLSFLVPPPCPSLSVSDACETTRFTFMQVQVLPGFVNEDFRPALWLFVPQFLRDLTASIEWTCMPATMHALSLAAFASIIGPFGAPPSPSPLCGRCSCALCGLLALPQTQVRKLVVGSSGVSVPA